MKRLLPKYCPLCKHKLIRAQWGGNRYKCPNPSCFAHSWQWCLGGDKRWRSILSSYVDKLETSPPLGPKTIGANEVNKSEVIRKNGNLQPTCIK
jgi:hypothetical protein